jgi:hypothetical protein
MELGASWVVSGQGDRLDQAAGPENLHHPFQVVDHGCQTDLSLRSAEAAPKEARMSEDSVFQCAEGMLDGGSSQSHRGGRCTLPHAIQRALMQVACTLRCGDEVQRSFIGRAPQVADRSV